MQKFLMDVAIKNISLVALILASSIIIWDLKKIIKFLSNYTNTLVMNRLRLVLILLLTGILPISSQIVNIPDTAFLNALLEEGVDTNGDGLISPDEAELITNLRIAGNWDEGKPGEIKNLKGIEAFINLDTLRCNYNQLSSLDLSEKTTLTFLRCNDNQLTNLDVSNGHSLVWLNCKMNHLSSLDVSGCFALTEIEFERNLITRLNLYDNAALEKLVCSKNLLTTLDISRNNALQKIDLRDNPNLEKVCVRTIPFPPENTIISVDGCPNIYFMSNCIH